MLGSREVDTSWFQSKIGFALDADQPVGETTIKAPNEATFTATFTGKAAHAGLAPEKGISAVQIATVAISCMKLLRIDEETTANIGSISAEGRVNIFPRPVRSLARPARWMRISSRRRSPICGRLWSRRARAARKIGVEPKCVAVGGCSDASILYQKGLETTVLSMGFEEVHSVRERMPLDQLEGVTEWALAIILD